MGKPGKQANLGTVDNQPDSSTKFCVLSIRLTPHASSDKLVYIPPTIKAYVRALAKDNEANEALVVLLAKVLSVPKSSVEIIKGHKSRQKTVKIFCHPEIIEKKLFHP